MNQAERHRELLELQQTLYQSSNPTRRWLHCQRRDWIEAALRQVGTVNRAIEIGPGSGVYLPLLCSLATEVTAADIEAAYLDHARTLSADLPNLSCATADITADTLDAGQYDLVLCSEVLEHVQDSPALLRGLAKLLATDGTLILSTPQRYSPLEVCAKIAFMPGIINLVRKVYAEPVLETGHINLLTEKELKQQAQAAGLSIQAEFKCGFYLPLIAEFLGSFGQRMLEFLQTRLRNSALDGLLWTQCYIIAHADDPSLEQHQQ